MADDAARGKKALEESKYEEAIERYSDALEVSPTSPDYLIQRSTAYQRAKKYPEALADANNAVIYAQKRAKRESIVEAQFRRGCAYYNLQRYGDAELMFSVVKRMNEKHKMVAIWEGKTKMSLKKLEEGDEKGNCNAKETPDAEELAGTDIEESKASTNGDATEAGNGTTAVPVAPQQTAPDKIRHEWYQNSENVYFTLLVKGLPKDKTLVDIQEHSLSISFPLATGSSYDFTLEPLFAAVTPDKCIPRILPTKIEVVLAKATPGQKWSALESSEPIATSTGSTTAGATDTDSIKQAIFKDSQPTGPAYPTSSKSGPKDWDKITQSLSTSNKEGADGKSGSLEDDDDYEGGDEANHFFKKLFKGASPETQKAMMKSYTESNGTALSTNWDEVSKGKVETLPPDGMEAKKW